MTTGLLAGLTVIEIAHPLTEYAGQVLAGLGATVYLVEPPEGAVTRRRWPFVPGVDPTRSTRASIAFLARNTGKRSVSIDAADEVSRALLTALCRRADIVLSVSTAALHPLVVAAAAPAQVTITDAEGLGVSTIVGFAASGGLSSSGWPHQPPCNAPSWLAHDGTGVYAAWLALVAAIARRRGSGRVHYEVPYQEAAVAAITPWTMPLFDYGMQVAGQGAASARLGAGPYPIYPCADGHVRVLTATPRQWQAFVQLLGSPDDLVDGPWRDGAFRAENFDALQLLCSGITRGRSVASLFHEGQRLGLTITPLYSLAQFRADPHVQARGLFVQVEDPEFGPMELMRAPLRITPAALETPPAPAPALGAHIDDARAWLAAPARTTTPREQRVDDAFDPARPLAGIRVLELGVGAVVPEAASHLALLGADVIKVESMVHVDFLRQSGLGGYLDVNNCATFNQLNLGTKSLAVDMRHPDGIALVRTLARRCDVVMENMRGSVVGRWRLCYEDVRALRADVVYLSSQGLGDGPYGEYQTYGPNLQTFSGVTAQWAHPDDPHPVGTTLNHPDHIAGKQALVPLLAALLRREAQGEGCRLEAAQVEAAAFLIGDRYLEQLLSGVQPFLRGNRSPDMAPHGCFRCADAEGSGDERWIAIAVEDDAQWQRLCDVVGASLAGVPGWAVLPGRLADVETIERLLADWVAPQDVAAVEALLRRVGVPACRVRTGADFASDATAAAAGAFPVVAHPTAGHRRYTALPLRDTAGKRPPTRRAPLLGEHVDHVLLDVLGLDAEAVQRLVAGQVVGR
jgi:crotonobetainyl-CoA:carnitine CoA-transferase CaiB-like acyl-CoA transferase